MNLLKLSFCAGLIVGLTAAEALAQAPSGHRLIAQDKGHVAIINAAGVVEWEIANPFVSHDIGVLPNGNFLLHSGPATITEVTPDNKVVWEYTSKPSPPYTSVVEVHAFQRLKNGLTMISETGNRRIIEVDKAGKIVHETPLTVD